MEILFTISTGIAIIAQLALVIGAIIYLNKKRDIAGWIMVIASLLSLFSSAGRPIFSWLSADQGMDYDLIILLQGLWSVASTFIYLLFGIGFIWAMTGFRKQEE